MTSAARRLEHIVTNLNLTGFADPTFILSDYQQDGEVQNGAYALVNADAPMNMAYMFVTWATGGTKSGRRKR